MKIKSTDTMTRNEIIETYEYCIGGYDVPFETMKKEVEKFLDEDRGSLNEAINELKESEFKDLELTGYYDY